MVLLSTGDRASHGHFLSTEINGLLYALRTVLLHAAACCCLLPARLYLVPLVGRKGETGKNSGAIWGDKEPIFDGRSSLLSDELSSYENIKIGGE